ncbi:MAG: hypothetical protein Q8O43_01450 [Dehalococcoidia bacterium]|nr:hypothetical protein [Dehalococcoidia bacterium]
MLEIRKTAVSFDEKDLMELERIMVDSDEGEAMKFLKKSVYDRISHAQQGKLKSHLDSTNPVEGFIKDNK